MDPSNNISSSDNESNNSLQVAMNNLGNSHNVSLQVDVDNVDQFSLQHNNNTTEELIESAETALDFIRSLLTSRILSPNTSENISMNIPIMPRMMNMSIAPHMVPINNIFRGGILERSFEQDKNKYKQVLSEKGNDMVQYIKYSCEEYPEQTLCVITMKPFESGDSIAKLPCNHIFEKEAILKWLKEEKASCPVCRFKLDSKEEIVNEKKTDASSTLDQFGIDAIRSIEFIQHPTRLINMPITQATLDPSAIPQRPRFAAAPPGARRRRNIFQLMNLIDHEQEEQEEEELQRAIFASLQDMSGN